MLTNIGPFATADRPSDGSRTTAYRPSDGSRTTAGRPSDVSRTTTSIVTPTLSCTQLAEQAGQLGEQDDDDVGRRQRANDQRPLMTSAFINCRPRSMSDGQSGFPIQAPSLPVFNSQHAPLDYIHSYGHDTLCDSNPDSPLTESDSEEEEEEEKSAPPARRPSLPAVGTASSHRFNLRQSGNRTSAAGSKSGTDTIYNLMRTISSKRRHSLGKPRKLKMAPSSDIREDYMKDIVVAAPSVSAEVAVEKRSLVKQLRARAHLEPFKANDSRLPDS